MSVDDRLREAFGETDRSWDEQVPEALAAVTARHRRETVVRRGAAAALVAAAAVVAVVVAAPDDGRESPAPPLTDPSHPHDVGTPNGPLEGRWTSGPITTEDVRAAAATPDVPAPPRRCWTCCLRGRSTSSLLRHRDGPEPGFPLARGPDLGGDVEMIESTGHASSCGRCNAPAAGTCTPGCSRTACCA